MANNEFDIFNLSVGDLQINDDPKSGTSDLYAPKPDQGKDGIYRALIRFLPNIKNPLKPYISKYVYWLEDETGGFYADSPSTIGEKCPVQDMFFKLRNSESALDKRNSELLKRKQVYYGLVQIVKDPHNPDLEGQVKIMKFGYTIKNKIEEELRPQFDEPTQVFDPFNGKNFELIISKKSNYPNYDSCKFQGTRSPMILNGKEVTEADKSKIIEYLNTAPELDSFDYKAWSEDQRTRILNLLNTLSGKASNHSTIAPKSNQSQSSNMNSNSGMTSNQAANAQTVLEEDAGEDEDDNLSKYIEDLDL